MDLHTTVLGHTYRFRDVADVMAKANEEKSGDRLAGIAAESALERVAAKTVLAGLSVADVREHPALPYESDDVTRVIQDSVDERVYDSIKRLTIGELRERILAADEDEIARLRPALTAEVIAAVCKLMGNLDLVYAARRMRVTATCRTTVGEPGVLASRLQPNQTTDDPEGIRLSALEGLSYACGDATVAVNPADGSPRSIARVMDVLEELVDGCGVPTQTCVLGHISDQMKAFELGSRADLVFQSIAGSEAGNRSFGITTAMIDEACQAALEACGDPARNVMYFETGQGSELSAGATGGADQLVLEARCYGYAKRWKPFLVNTVVGFIGPEYLAGTPQFIRAGLEDHFMGKLTGVSMGCDACYTNHMEADQNDVEDLAVLLASAGANYLINVPCGDDIMLNYQSLGYHDITALRRVSGTRPTPQFECWCVERGILTESGELGPNAGCGWLLAEGA